ncbi:pSer/pThr/pTyr-binding forkhead associated (FHA) protein [Antricoccus suffuscus]|uniref:PSer/pThr/pTyr-binding forkhead associated (FHA) protein n=1 Tax=Antricoccus suffuscus TaxID=1629062 RepID=A0A2T1A2F8_9ACTN|nr:DUF3662 and FHA domain-containing protein [Antricoccus suffuscus]PRZ42789.1 pSer/pThr/pTyr-binding forkhead associated (FHA) protein [Antricoccus suffuscus]
MGVFSRFERKLENTVGNAFARVFKGKVHPSEIARALKIDADDNKVIVGHDRVMVPNRYVVQLGATDYDHLHEWETQLTRSLSDMVREHAASEGWSTYGQIKIQFARQDSLSTGVFHVQSSVSGNKDSMPPPPPPVSRSTAPPIAAPPPPIPRSNDDDEPSTRLIGRQPAAPPSPAPAAYQHLIVVDGPNTKHVLKNGKNVIGRGSAADIQITDTGVSRLHAQVVVDQQGADVQDLQSTNGTHVNGRKVSSQRLTHGDVIRLGHSVLVYRYEPGDGR